MVESASLSVPSTIEVGSSTTLSAEFESDIKDFGTLTAEVTFLVGGRTVGSELPHETFAGGTINQGSSFDASTNFTPSGSQRNVEVTVSAVLSYSNGDESTITDTQTVNIIEEPAVSGGEEFGTGNSTADKLSEFYETRTPFSIDGITYDASAPATLLARDNSSEISFEYENPSISVDSSARFVKHELVGTVTVRQKIGQDPIEVTVNGVCFRETARRIDGLRYARTGTLRSDRFDGSSLDVQFASASTDPLEDGSAISLTEANELFSFTINCTEVL